MAVAVVAGSEAVAEDIRAQDLPRGTSAEVVTTADGKSSRDAGDTLLLVRTVNDLTAMNAEDLLLLLAMIAGSAATTTPPVVQGQILPEADDEDDSKLMID